MHPEVKKELRRLKQLGYDGQKFGGLAYLGKNLGMNQSAYSFINQSNKFLAQEYGVSINAFVQEIVNPCIIPNFCVFMSQYLGNFTGKLVFCQTSMIPVASLARRAEKILYLYDKPDREIPADCKVVLRSETDKDFFGLEGPVVKDFNIMELINIESK